MALTFVALWLCVRTRYMSCKGLHRVKICAKKQDLNKWQCKTNPIWPARPGMGAGRRAAMPGRRAIVQNEPNLAPRGSGAGGKTCKTNPILPRRRRMTEESVQNEAKLLGGLGCVGKGSCRLGRASDGQRNVQNEPNFR
jgi:hypothetical protein